MIFFYPMSMVVRNLCQNPINYLNYTLFINPSNVDWSQHSGNEKPHLKKKSFIAYCFTTKNSASARVCPNCRTLTIILQRPDFPQIFTDNIIGRITYFSVLFIIHIILNNSKYTLLILKHRTCHCSALYLHLCTLFTRAKTQILLGINANV